MRPKLAEAKNHPVNGFSAPRAGGGTAPVTPGIPFSPPNKRDTQESVSFVCEIKEEGIRRVRPARRQAKNHPVKLKKELQQWETLRKQPHCGEAARAGKEQNSVKRTAAIIKAASLYKPTTLC